MNLAHERVHPSDALVSLPIEDRYSIAEISLAVTDKEFSFLARAATSSEVIEAPGLARVDASLNPAVAVRVNERSSLGGLANNPVDIGEKGSEVEASLPVRYVDEAHHGYSIAQSAYERVVSMALMLVTLKLFRARIVPP